MVEFSQKVKVFDLQFKQNWYLFGVFGVHKTSWETIPYNFDRDGNLKICLLPGLEAQKVEKH